MKINRIISGLLACAVIGGVLPYSSGVTENSAIMVSAAEEYTEGTYESLTYRNYGDYIEISDCDESAAEVVIPDEIEGLPVTGIGFRAFSDCSSLTSVIIPDSVTSISAFAFDNTPWLDTQRQISPLVIVNNILIDGTTCEGNIVIPNSVTSIGDNAFDYCSLITSVIIPDSVNNIGVCAFHCCTGLTSMIIPDSVTNIGLCVFEGCSSLISVIIPETVTDIPYAAFNCCESLSSINIPNNVTTIGQEAFSRCTSLTEITIPDCVTFIDYYAFYNCDNLSSITIGHL